MCNQEKNQSMETDQEMTEVIELANKDVEIIIILHKLLKGKKNIMKREVEDIREK